MPEYRTETFGEYLSTKKNNFNSTELKGSNINNSIDHYTSSIDLTEKSLRDVPLEGFSLGAQGSIKLI